MYKSPITIKTEEIARNIMDKQEEYILTQVQMCVDVDKDELLKALQYDRGQYEKGWKDRDNEIVRCKDCKWYKRKYILHRRNYSWNEHYTECSYLEAPMDDNDYCSLGERKDEVKE